MAAISLEILVGVIIIYVGNLHHRHVVADECATSCKLIQCVACLSRRITCGASCRDPHETLPMHFAPAFDLVSDTELGVGPTSNVTLSDREVTQFPLNDPLSSCADWPLEPCPPFLAEIEESDARIHLSRMKMADAEVKMTRAKNYVKVIGEVFERNSGVVALEEELDRARDVLSSAIREREEGEAEERLALAQQYKARLSERHFEDRRNQIISRKRSSWQEFVNYLLFFVMLVNIFITTFGITGGRTTTSLRHHSTHAHLTPPSP